MRIKSLAVILSALVVSGCAANRKTLYFQNADTALQSVAAAADAAHYEYRIMPYDNLLLVVSAPNPSSVEVFNPANTGNGDLPRGYLVDEQGYINGIPLIGRAHVGGLSKVQACAVLRDEIAKQIESPTVDIRVTNFKVTVLGEVRSPGVYTAESGKLSLPEALGMAGDLTIQGKRDDILLCRVTPEGKTFQRIDITNADLFFSPYYYLQQDDVIYVSPNRPKAVAGNMNPATATTISILGVIMSIITFVKLF